MDRRVTGWLLLGLALAGAGLVGALGLATGRVDPGLAGVAALAVASGVLTVALDRRAIGLRAARPEDGDAAPGRPRPRDRRRDG